MILYHGSNIEIDNPRIIDSDRALDFGKGFYLTTDFEQARKWAVLTTERRKNGEPLVTVFEVLESDFQNLNILRFDSANKEWLEFVSDNRRGIDIGNDLDVVIGPVADDNTMPVLTLYLRGDYDTDEAIKRLLTQRLKDQVVFKTKESIEVLRFKEVIKV